MGFALCQFAYWYLFWSAASMLKGEGDTNFVTLALALLSLNTLATPLAMHYAKRDQTERRSTMPYIILAFPLALSIVLFELDMTWRELSNRLSFLDGIDWDSLSVTISSPAFFVCLCLLAAVFAEAVGDFLLTRQEIMSTQTKIVFVNQLDVATFADREANNFIKLIPLDQLLRIIFADCKEKFETADELHEGMLNKRKGFNSTQMYGEARDEAWRLVNELLEKSGKALEEAEGRLNQAVTYMNELSAATPQRIQELRRIVAREFPC
jgi:hypothetical protein